MTENERSAFCEEMEKEFGVRLVKDDPLIPILSFMKIAMGKVDEFNHRYDEFYEIQNQEFSKHVQNLTNAIKSNDAAFASNQQQLISVIKDFVKGQNIIFNRITEMEKKKEKRKKKKFWFF